MVVMAEEGAGRADQNFFGRVVGEQALEPSFQKPETVSFVLGEGRGHTVAEEVLRLLTPGRYGPADGCIDGAVEGDVEQDLAVPVRVVSGQDVDGQPPVQTAA